MEVKSCADASKALWTGVFPTMSVTVQGQSMYAGDSTEETKCHLYYAGFLYCDIQGSFGLVSIV